MLEGLSQHEKDIRLDHSAKGLMGCNPELMALAATNPHEAYSQALDMAAGIIGWTPERSGVQPLAALMPGDAQEAIDVRIDAKAKELVASDEELKTLAASNPHAAWMRALPKAAVALNLGEAQIERVRHFSGHRED